MNPILKSIQITLNNTGHDCGDVDGLTGIKTAEALSKAILDKTISFSCKQHVDLKKSLVDATPTRRNIEDVYGVISYKDVGDRGAIKITNATKWRKHFTRIDVVATDDMTPIPLTVNKKIALNVLCAFAEIKLHNNALPKDERWTPKRVDSYCPRHNRWDQRRPLSVHTWAAAIDIDPKTNGVKMDGDIPEWVIEILQSWAAVWGGDWRKYPDPMHFQWMR